MSIVADRTGLLAGASQRRPCGGPTPPLFAHIRIAMKIQRFRFALVVVLLILAHEAAGQAFTRPAPTPNDTLVSPRLAEDHRVLFQIYAPEAENVLLRGDWMSGLDVATLARDSVGVWSVTVGPLVPDYYSYAYVVDGVRTVDPRNPEIKQGISSLDNAFLLPGAESDFEANRVVPHGEIRQVWYTSTTLGTQRRMHVYTPPGYPASQTDYPVFYLLHGGGDDDSGWSTIGRAGFILDNLLAEGKVVPMVIAMPNGSLPRPENLTRAAADRSSAEFRAAMEEIQGRFTRELMEDVIPLVEERFKGRAQPEARAIAGLSMGGGQTLRVLTSQWQDFGYVAIWSAGLLGQSAESFKENQAAFLAQADEISGKMKLLSISVGDQDFLFESSKNLSQLFTDHGIRHELNISGGGHTWINWRQYLSAYAPRLFQ